MRIGIDGRFALGARRGIGVYTLNLIRHLRQNDSENEYVIYVSEEDVEGLLPEASNFTLKVIRSTDYLTWEQILLPSHAKRDGLDILHCTANTGPLFLPEIHLVVTVHDVMYLPAYSMVVPKPRTLYQRLGRVYRAQLVPKIVRNASAVVTVSNHSRKEIIEYLSVPSERVHVTYEAFDHSKIFCGRLSCERYRGQLKRDYILVLGAKDPRKNTALIVRSFLEMREDFDLPYQLVVVGLETDDFPLLGLDDVHMGEDVVVTGFVSDEELVDLYMGSAMFIYLSLYEGFGLPLLEAMACGAPVIASNVSSIPEIVGDAGILASPTDGAELKEAIWTIHTNPEMQSRLAAKGRKRALDFSWDKMAQETIRIYRSCMTSSNLSK